jgi:protein-tyrosine-phosphatase
MGDGDPVTMKNVLFVCVHNSGRSQMAEAFFNAMSKGNAKASSAGTVPGETVNPIVVKAMQEVGMDVSGNKPKALTPEMVDRVDLVITMGCGAEAVCPATWIETRDWALEDPEGKPLAKVREIRDEIEARVSQLMREVGA